MRGLGEIIWQTDKSEISEQSKIADSILRVKVDAGNHTLADKNHILLLYLSPYG